MLYGLDISAVGKCGDPRSMAEFAHVAEQSGWDGIFLEDYVFFWAGGETYDPWVTLAAIAMRTERVRLGLQVSPLARRRPWKVAREAVTLDHLSGGRLILGVGLGDASSPDFAKLGEPTDSKQRAEMLDEALQVIVGLWSGDSFHFQGKHYRVDEVTFLPPPVQKPRIPIWVGGAFTLEGPRKRALRWDGSCLYRVPPPAWEDMTPDDVRTLRSLVERTRGSALQFDICIGGRRRRNDLDAERAYIRALAAAGATWWAEHVPPETDCSEVRRRIERGPIRVD